jgi:hypothetical protein
MPGRAAGQAPAPDGDLVHLQAVELERAEGVGRVLQAEAEAVNRVLLGDVLLEILVEGTR